MNTVWLVNLNTISYGEGLSLQHRLVTARKRGALNDTLLLLEHPPVLTLGRNAHDSNILASREFLQQLGIEVYRVERGGDVTYHGPGQLVGYPILDLRNFRQDVGWFVRSIEETLIRALGDFGIPGRRVEKLVGVWTSPPPRPAPPRPNARDVPPSAPLPLLPYPNVSTGEGGGAGVGGAGGDAKIAQIGARIEEWVTYHGFALNVDPNMRHFDLIVPCGISDKMVVSMAQWLGKPVALSAVRERVAARFAEVFGAELLAVTPEELDTRLRESEPSENEIAQG